METVKIYENEEKKPEFLKVDQMEDGKGGSILLSVCHIVSVRYYLFSTPSRPCLELRMIDGSDIRMTGIKAERLWPDLRKIFSIWQYQGEE